MLGYVGVQGIQETFTGRATTPVPGKTTMSQNDETDRDVILTGQEIQDN